MSLWRYLGLAMVGIWLVVAVVYAVSDVSVLIDPVSRRAQHLCFEDRLGSVVYLNGDLTDKECFPRLARRAAFDVLIVSVPVMLGLALVSARRTRRRVRTYAVLSSSVSSPRSSDFSRK